MIFVLFRGNCLRKYFGKLLRINSTILLWIIFSVIRLEILSETSLENPSTVLFQFFSENFLGSLLGNWTRNYSTIYLKNSQAIMFEIPNTRFLEKLPKQFLWNFPNELPTDFPTNCWWNCQNYCVNLQQFLKETTAETPQTITVEVTNELLGEFTLELQNKLIKELLESLPN